MNKTNRFEEAEKDLNSQNFVFSNVELSKISAIAEGIRQLQDYKHIRAVSDFNRREIVLMSKIGVLADFWDIQEYNKILDDLSVNKLSFNRGSRKEILEGLIGMSGKRKLGQRVKDVFTGGEQ